MRQLFVPFMVGMLATQTVYPDWGMAAASQPLSHDVSLDEGASISGMLSVPGGAKKISVSASGENVRTVLHQLSEQGGFNLVMDESVSGNVSVELNHVTINQALQAVAALANLEILPQNGNIYLAISKQAAEDKGISRQLSKMIKVYYSSASRIADMLNKSLFAAGGGGSGPLKAKADPRTNSIIVVGTARDIQLAESAVSRLDVPRQSKTFYLSHANALDVATMLSSSIFNDGNAGLSLGNGASSSSGGQGGSTPSPLRVEKQDIQEGSGINAFGSSSGSGSASAGLSSTVTLRGFVKSSDTLQVSSEGALVVPDTRQNSVTIMGTAEQIALAESLIPTMDAQLPQVSIEASLIEITDTGIKDLGTRWGLSNGRVQGGFNNVALSGLQSNPNIPVGVQPAGTGLIGTPTVDPTDTAALARSSIMLSTNPLARNSDYVLQIRSLITQNKAKVLANPTVVATHDTESIISIVDEVVRRVTVQLDSSGFATQTVELGEAGIVMDILPKIGEDGTINMRLRPSVTSILDQTRDSLGNIVTLLSKRDMLTQNVRIQDGQTLVIGGLIQQTDALRQDKLPGMGELPIVGAMFRSSQRTGKRSEIVMMITPHILNKTRPTPVVNTTSFAPPESDELQGGSR